MSALNYTEADCRTTMDKVIYGDGIPDDDELGLLGDVSGRRVVELGITGANSVALALRGAKAITLDPDGTKIAALRETATEAEVWIECHEGDLADLGFAPSGTIDIAISVHSLDSVSDLGRILRQVHRVLKPGAPFICVVDHPFASVGPDSHGSTRRYGETTRTISELLSSFDRSNFRVEVLHELGMTDDKLVPTTLATKLRKQGS